MNTEIDKKKSLFFRFFQIGISGVMAALCMYIGISALVFMYAFIGTHTEAIKLMDLLIPFVDLWSEVTSTEHIGLGINNALNMGTKHLFINNTIAVIALLVLKTLVKRKEQK
ncbi:hypothetical protein P4159_00560 [Bacillus thuringiensis]|uniref:Uncharacterized protein n=1 Tax=Bacillus thuringiensis subsp. kurstaki TaxID=29339 RepID=Q3YN43_BACTK|nr:MULTISPECIES: hypothetical protein [Bacillus cereus group]MEB9963603.1 hypothetical protein [Bacillus cereus]AAZ06602.1 hypothetical protein pAW63_032 [Bacillus thuringiensis serovar kurstaki]AGE81679.1 hypothetical protein HD73_7532 [Bacillus thuringiensis serovar kurstaki str. HD73]AND11261.1 hypothetical protein Bt4C1_28815 [Bacillus thuringiensis serovar alesti]EJV73144.1 hypothetical protein IG1_05893 [Bacillus cereus HD73]